MQSCLEDYTVI